MADEFISLQYVPDPVPEDPQELPLYLTQELGRLGGVLEGATYFKLQELNNPPPRLLEGMLVLADGTNWDPGSGQGVYTYYGGSWNKLG